MSEVDVPSPGASPMAVDVPALEGTVRRVVAAKLGRHPDVDDLVQETLSRVLAAGDRIGDGMTEAYAVRTARNLIATMFRQRERQQRYQPRLVEPPTDERPDDDLLAVENEQAVATALARLPDREREVLLAHEVGDVDTRTLAAGAGSTPGAVAAQLSRSRARLRVEYLVARRPDPPPTKRCRPTLIALSSNDRRRQREVDAAGHLLECSYCTELAPRLAERAERRGDEEVVVIERDADVVTARQRVRRLAERLEFSPTDLTLIATAVSEMARNIVRFAGRGTVTAVLVDDPRPGIVIEARDAGPGIADVEQALADGYSTYDGLGLGLPGARRLMDEFEVVSVPGTGTTVTMTKWQSKRPSRPANEPAPTRTPSTKSASTESP